MEKYLTEFTNKFGEQYGWHVWAESIEEAKEIVDRRGIYEIILGKASQED